MLRHLTEEAKNEQNSSSTFLTHLGTSRRGKGAGYVNSLQPNLHLIVPFTLHVPL